jgi:ribosomal-protein-alanine N-acetyltransferase
VLLRAPQMSDFPQWAQLARTQPRVSHAVGADLAVRRSDPRRRSAAAAPLCRGHRADRSYPFFVFRKSDGAMIGGITLANVRRGIARPAASATGSASPMPIAAT